MLDLRHEPMSPVFDKWHLGGLPIAAVLHRFAAPDEGPPHSHPWPFRSFILAGGYVEEVFNPDNGASRLVEHVPGDTITVDADHIHRIVALPNGECWTLITPLGPKVQEPGFYEWRGGKPWHRPWHRAEFLPLEESA